MSEYNYSGDLLVELIRNLNQHHMGDVCESIVKFPAYFHNNPFPMIISPCVMKLSEIFQTQSNYIRILILQVLIESERHLDKVDSIDVFVRNILKVGDANDPLALSLLLKMLGVISRVVPDNENLHFLIKKSMDSIDSVELESAIEASVKFATQSQKFAEIIYPKVVGMLESPKFPIETKIRLLNIINNITHNYNISQDAKEKLIKLLELYPNSDFVSATLHTLTLLADASILQIPSQVKLLLEYANKFPRMQVKMEALKNLQILVQKNSRQFDQSTISKLFESIIESAVDKKFPKNILELSSNELTIFNQRCNVVATLLRSQGTFIDFEVRFEASLKITVNFCEKIIRHLSITGFDSSRISRQLHLVSICFELLTNVSQNSEKLFFEEQIFEKTCFCFDSFFLMKLNFQLVKSDKPKFQNIFKCLIRFLRLKSIDSIQICRAFQSIRFVFIDYQSKQDFWFEMLCETLCTLGILTSNKNSGFTSDDVYNIICKDFQSPASNKNNGTLLKLFIIWFQLKMNHSTTDKEIDGLLQSLNNVNLWTCYKIVREAMRYSNHLFAFRLIEKIQDCMETIENTAFWMNGLKFIAKAESLLLSNSHSQTNDSKIVEEFNYNNELKYDEQITKSILFYTRAYSQLKASEAYCSSMKFQNEFVRLRLKYLQIHKRFRQCCRLIQTSPPPSCLEPAVKLSDDLSRLGRIVPSMNKCSQEFTNLSIEYSNLFQISFNADPQSLSIVQLLQHSCIILSEIIKIIFHRTDSGENVSLHPNFIGKIIDNNITEQMPFRELCSDISKMVDTKEIDNLLNLDNEEFLKCLTKQVYNMIRISTRLLGVSLPFPRYYFQPIQSLSLKLELSSKSPRNNSQEFGSVANSVFVLNVEGVIVDNNQRFEWSHSLLHMKRASSHHSSTSDSQKNNFLPSLSLSNSAFDKNGDSIRNINKIFLICTVQTMRDYQNSEAVHSTLQAVVDPLNDYFKTYFMLPLKTPGLYHVSVEASMVDDNDAQWKTGPAKQAYIRVSEDIRMV